MKAAKSNPKKPDGDLTKIENFSKEDWKTLCDQSPDHIVLLDKKLCIVYTNRPSPGLTLQDLISVPLYTLVEKTRQDEIRKKLTGTLKTGQPCRYETQYHPPKGETIYYQSEAVAWKAKGKTFGVILTARDITDQKRIQDSVEKLASLSIVQEVTGSKRNRLYHAQRILQILEDPAPLK